MVNIRFNEQYDQNVKFIKKNRSFVGAEYLPLIFFINIKQFNCWHYNSN